ncbi:MAG TPA: DedA family protein [Gemmatimonadaceae bacterium]|jgi:membrane protein DedA with SNARE-associated domain
MLHESFLQLLRTYGYGLLFLVVGLESLGVPVPGETALVAAAALAARGHMKIALVIAVAAAAAILGDAGGYWIGRRGGIAFVRRYGRFFRMNDAKLEYIKRYFERHGAKTVFFGRFIALLRTWAALFAGVGCMPYGRFTAYNASGGIVWAITFGVIGYLFGRNLERIQNIVGDASWALAVAVVVIAVGLWIWRRRRESRRRVRASGDADDRKPPDAAG